MSIFRDQILCPNSKGTIHKLIVIRVGSNQFHTEMRVNKTHVFLIQNQ